MENPAMTNSKLLQFKIELNRVFDDDLLTKQWHNYCDYAIVSLIVISTLEFFLSTYDSIAARYGQVLKIVDVVTTLLFAVEVSLRIWTADIGILEQNCPRDCVLKNI